MSEVIRFADAAALAESAAARFSHAAQEAITERGWFRVALSGGSTPRALFQRLNDTQTYPVEWGRVHVLWSDERAVPPDHPDSNYHMAHEALLAQVPIPPAQVHRIMAERPPQAAAARYEEVLDALPGGDTLDLVLLGMGADGHTASLFPGTAALNEQARRVVENYVPQMSAWRITSTAPYINRARRVWFLVSGADKAATLAAVLHGPHDPARYPAQMIAPHSGQLCWLLG